MLNQPNYLFFLNDTTYYLPLLSYKLSFFYGVKLNNLLAKIHICRTNNAKPVGCFWFCNCLQAP